MAKLVDLLAKHLKEWPDAAEYARQDADKEVCFRGDECSIEHDFFMAEMAEDAAVDGALGTTKVYMKDWLAARDRLHAETLKGMHASGVLEAQEFDTDQALWDKVASNVIGGLSAKAWNDYGVMVEHSMRIADAFMAERAKRLKGGV